MPEYVVVVSGSGQVSGPFEARDRDHAYDEWLGPRGLAARASSTRRPVPSGFVPVDWPDDSFESLAVDERDLYVATNVLHEGTGPVTALGSTESVLTAASALVQSLDAMVLCVFQCSETVTSFIEALRTAADSTPDDR